VQRHLLVASIIAAIAPAVAFAEEKSVMLKEGDAAPSFSAKGDDGKDYSLAALKGKNVVLYFYPKDDTMGCTIEAKAFRDDHDKYTAKNAVVLGVSLDDAVSHKAFREKYQLNFPLLTGGEAIAKAYGVPISGGVAKRQTFVIGGDGKITKIYGSVSVVGHSGDVLGNIK
jgi:peroxiredoxin Q/BCP